MMIEDILLIEDWDTIVSTIIYLNDYTQDPERNQKIYDNEHAVLQRPDKIKKNEKGIAIGRTKVAKLPVNFQKKIVESSVAFLLGNGVSVQKVSDELDEQYEEFRNVLVDAKFQQNLKLGARKEFIQTRSAKLFYIKTCKDKMRKLSMSVLSYENGSFYPNFNEYGDMDSFLRLYTVNEIVNGDLTSVDKLTLYTNEKVYSGTYISNWVITEEVNVFGKIPVVFYNQDYSEWHDVKDIIDNYEFSFSQLADTNEYFSAPMMKIFGKLLAAPNKDAQGKILQFENATDGQGNSIKGDAEYLEWNERSESLKLQFDLLEKHIFSITNTPDISFNNLLQNKMSSTSGIALKIMMLDAIIKSVNKQEEYEVNIQRELTLAKKGFELIGKGNIDDMKFNLTFNSIMPSNIAETIDYLIQATGGQSVLSQKTGVALNPVVKNPVQEIENIDDESGLEGGTFNL